jgi:hypothetical protein
MQPSKRQYSLQYNLQYILQYNLHYSQQYSQQDSLQDIPQYSLQDSLQYHAHLDSLCSISRYATPMLVGHMCDAARTNSTMQRVQRSVPTSSPTPITACSTSTNSNADCCSVS